jgi:HlyD family secretion protein
MRPYFYNVIWRMGRQSGFAPLVAGVLIVVSGCSFDNGVKSDGSGTIECTQVQVAPQVSGYIQRLRFDEGDEVRAGELVFKINPEDYRLRVAEARAAVLLASNQLALVLAGARIEDVEAARAKVQELRAIADGADADLKRIEQVFRSGSATQKQLDDARVAAEKAKAAVAAAEQNLARLIAGARKEEIEVARSQYELAMAQLAKAEKALADCEVYAPIDGVVTTKVREQGEFVSAGMPVLTLSKLDEVWLSVYVPESRLADVRLGQEAYVMVDGRDDVFKGKVTFISPIAEFTPRNTQTPEERAKLVYRIKITVSNTNRVLKPGMPADGFFHYPKITQAGAKTN